MNEEKKDILDFFFDGDIIITWAQGYTNISKVLETEEYKFTKVSQVNKYQLACL